MIDLSRYWSPEALLYELAIEEPSEIDLDYIASECGVQIRYKELSGCEAKIIGLGERALVTVDPRIRLERQRFSIGHELGHWMHERGELAHIYIEKSLFAKWLADGEDDERRADRFSPDLLLPKSMFVPRVKNKSVTFETAKKLAAEFRTSLTATSIRLVETTPEPAIIYFTNANSGRRLWFNRSEELPDRPWVIDFPGTESVAKRLIEGERLEGPAEVPASAWFEDENISRCTVMEDSIWVSKNTILSIVWWNDYDQLLELVDGEEDDLLFA